MRERSHIPVTRRLALLKEETGSGLVEYAIAFTVFMTLLLGVADFGRAMYAYHFVSSAAREATRYAIVRGCTPTTTDCPTPATNASIQTFVRQVPLGIDSSQVTATTTWTPDHKPGSVVEVQVQYNFSFVVPFVSKLVNGGNPLALKSTSQMVISQ